MERPAIGSLPRFVDGFGTRLTSPRRHMLFCSAAPCDMCEGVHITTKQSCRLCDQGVRRPNSGEAMPELHLDQHQPGGGWGGY